MSEDEKPYKRLHPDVLAPGEPHPPKDGETAGAGSTYYPDSIPDDSGSKAIAAQGLRSMRHREDQRDFLQAQLKEGKTREGLIDTYQISNSEDINYYFSDTTPVENDAPVGGDEPNQGEKKTNTPKAPSAPAKPRRTQSRDSYKAPYIWPEGRIFEYRLPGGGKTRGTLNPSEYVRAFDDGLLIFDARLQKQGYYPLREEALRSAKKKS